ncbi:MAG: bifunctional adenosylcobinamide kinase/adenosylcobinamide-phosphate guanylyltransferase [Armatimonadetes bacterium]|nr:bifunctional adenosylcobinamide kinase/adenosylcobinamide-phosphate guanylyltransferase [Armatimonadota bacterium]
MAEVILVTGGARGGKSGYAQQWAESLPGARAIIATCPVLDGEMAARVARHQADRAGRGWRTVEEPLDLARALAELADTPVVLIDCLTLWVNNLLHRAGEAGLMFGEDEVVPETDRLTAALAAHPGTVILVSGEVGWGIVPANELARRFRDVAGRVNQRVAAAADRVVLMVSGLPMAVKGGLP